jgi:hypothetical protein
MNNIILVGNGGRAEDVGRLRRGGHEESAEDIEGHSASKLFSADASRSLRLRMLSNPEVSSWWHLDLPATWPSVALRSPEE